MVVCTCGVEVDLGVTPATDDEVRPKQGGRPHQHAYDEGRPTPCPPWLDIAVGLLGLEPRTKPSRHEQ